MKKDLEEFITSVKVLLDNVDYVEHNCSVTDMVGAVCPASVLVEVRETMKKVEKK